MADLTGPTPGDAPATDAMRRDLADMQRQVRDLKALQASGRNWVALTLVVTIALFALFTYATYHRISRNFDQQSVQQAISTHGNSVLPIAQQVLFQTGRTLFPVYQEAVVTTLKQRGPKVAQDTVDHLQGMPKQMGQHFQEKVADAYDKAIKRIEPEFKAAYPNIGDEKRQQMLQSFAADEIQSQNKRIADRVTTLYTQDLVHMQSVMDKFEPADGGKAVGGEDVLEKQFLHTMVALLDAQVDQAYADQASDGQTAAAAAYGGSGEPSKRPAPPSTRPAAATP